MSFVDYDIVYPAKPKKGDSSMRDDDGPTTSGLSEGESKAASANPLLIVVVAGIVAVAIYFLWNLAHVIWPGTIPYPPP